MLGHSLLDLAARCHVRIRQAEDVPHQSLHRDEAGSQYYHQRILSMRGISPPSRRQRRSCHHQAELRVSRATAFDINFSR